MSASEEHRSTTDSRFEPKSVEVPLSSGGSKSRPVLASDSQPLRKSLIDAMNGHQAHLDFDAAIDGFTPEMRGKKVAGAPHSAWQLLEHLRIAQGDILEFSKDTKHKSPKWPDEYWPKEAAPTSPEAWDHSVAQFQRDRTEMGKLINDKAHALIEPLAGGDGQTLLREALLIANHNSYHLGELVFLKKQLLASK